MAENERQTVKPKRGYGWIVLGAFLFAVMFYLYYAYPEALIGSKQPISFSHRIHAGVKQINCRFCHPDVERSWNAGLPPVEKCFFCHKYIIPDHPEIQKEKAYSIRTHRYPGCVSSGCRTLFFLITSPT